MKFRLAGTKSAAIDDGLGVVDSLMVRILVRRHRKLKVECFAAFGNLRSIMIVRLCFLLLIIESG